MVARAADAVPQRVLGHRLDPAGDPVVRDQRPRPSSSRSPRSCCRSRSSTCARGSTALDARADRAGPQLRPQPAAQLRSGSSCRRCTRTSSPRCASASASSWKVALTAELFGGNAGLGYLVNVARQEFDTPTIFAVIVLIIAFVYCRRTGSCSHRCSAMSHALTQALEARGAPARRAALDRAGAGRRPRRRGRARRGGRCRRGCRPSCCPTPRSVAKTTAMLFVDPAFLVHTADQHRAGRGVGRHRHGARLRPRGDRAAMCRSPKRS